MRPNVFVAPPHGLEHFHFGFHYALADLFWMRSLQDFDFCESTGQQSKCRQSGWLFQMLDVITDLDPKFRVAYSAGGLALTVIISDVTGASRIFDKGVQAFPKNWPLLYRAAYHALYEERNFVKAADLMKQAGQNGGPDWVFELAGRLYTQSGQRELAERMLSEMDSSNLDEEMKEKMRQRFQEKIQSLNHEIPGT